MAEEADLHWYQGEDVTVTVTMDPATSISGWTLAFTLKRGAGDSSALVSKTTTAGTITITDAANGVFQIIVLAADTSTLAPGAYRYDVRRTDSGQVTTLVEGSVVLRPKVGST